MAQKQPGKPGTELQRRRLARQAAGKQRHAEPDGEPQTTAGWWRQFEADLADVDRAIELEHQAAIDAGQPWPPIGRPEAKRETVRAPKPGTSIPEQSEILVPELNHDGERAARLDELRARADDAVRRIEAQRAELDASREYTARSSGRLRLSQRLTRRPKHLMRSI